MTFSMSELLTSASAYLRDTAEESCVNVVAQFGDSVDLRLAEPRLVMNPILSQVIHPKVLGSSPESVAVAAAIVHHILSIREVPESPVCATVDNTLLTDLEKDPSGTVETLRRELGTLGKGEVLGSKRRTRHMSVVEQNGMTAERLMRVRHYVQGEVAPFPTSNVSTCNTYTCTVLALCYWAGSGDPDVRFGALTLLRAAVSASPPSAALGMTVLLTCLVNTCTSCLSDCSTGVHRCVGIDLASGAAGVAIASLPQSLGADVVSCLVSVTQTLSGVSNCNSLWRVLGGLLSTLTLCPHLLTPHTGVLAPILRTIIHGDPTDGLPGKASCLYVALIDCGSLPPPVLADVVGRGVASGCHGLLLSRATGTGLLGLGCSTVAHLLLSLFSPSREARQAAARVLGCCCSAEANAGLVCAQGLERVDMVGRCVIRAALSFADALSVSLFCACLSRLSDLSISTLGLDAHEGILIGWVGGVAKMVYTPETLGQWGDPTVLCQERGEGEVDAEVTDLSWVGQPVPAPSPCLLDRETLQWMVSGRKANARHSDEPPLLPTILPKVLGDTAVLGAHHGVCAALGKALAKQRGVGGKARLAEAFLVCGKAANMTVCLNLIAYTAHYWADPSILASPYAADSVCRALRDDPVEVYNSWQGKVTLSSAAVPLNVSMASQPGSIDCAEFMSMNAGFEPYASACRQYHAMEAGCAEYIAPFLSFCTTLVHMSVPECIRIIASRCNDTAAFAVDAAHSLCSSARQFPLDPLVQLSAELRGTPQATLPLALNSPALGVVTKALHTANMPAGVALDQSLCRHRAWFSALTSRVISRACILVCLGGDASCALDVLRKAMYVLKTEPCESERMYVSWCIGSSISRVPSGVQDKIVRNITRFSSSRTPDPYRESQSAQLRHAIEVSVSGGMGRQSGLFHTMHRRQSTLLSQWSVFADAQEATCVVAKGGDASLVSLFSHFPGAVPAVLASSSFITILGAAEVASCYSPVDGPCMRALTGWAVSVLSTAIETGAFEGPSVMRTVFSVMHTAVIRSTDPSLCRTLCTLYVSGLEAHVEGMAVGVGGLYDRVFPVGCQAVCDCLRQYAPALAARLLSQLGDTVHSTPAGAAFSLLMSAISAGGAGPHSPPPSLEAHAVEGGDPLVEEKRRLLLYLAHRDRRHHSVDIPSSLKTTLRPFQILGVTWLDALVRLGAGGVLADDMGTGKTLQLLAAVSLCKARGSTLPSLVAVPDGLEGQWMDEIHTHTSLIGHRHNRETKGGKAPWTNPSLSNTDQPDVIVVGLRHLSDPALLERSYSIVALDEGHVLSENRYVYSHIVALGNRASARIILAGTPVLQRLSDIYPVMTYAVPGLLGDKAEFVASFPTLRDSRTGAFRTTTTQSVQRERLQQRVAEDRIVRLRGRIRPFVLRRTRADVITELPRLTSVPLLLDLSPLQLSLYTSICRAHPSLIDSVAEACTGTEGCDVYTPPATETAAQADLLKVCTHPTLLGVQGESSKYSVTSGIIGSLGTTSKAVIFYSTPGQEAELSQCVDAALKVQGRRSVCASVAKHLEESVSAFMSADVAVLLVPYSVGAVGLNLQAADTVVLLESAQWAIEEQAIARVYRMGQTRCVTVYRLVAKDTYEHRLWQVRESAKGDAVALLEE
ncbi:hypothetical protein KIPB_000202 [Kipferlia bialata]|uniref:Helicase ATP-binding domain-containing protein n=1 Tax=Kipferlia bialata TaxID=797122 RepID=A0A9K3GEI2_9EUKA|nr:hypothetical protein KIPB_000202 [Kipferlia bialata]|eukprot:g202.t1